MGVGCHFLLQWIFPVQGLNLHLLSLLCCRRILYLGKPYNLICAVCLVLSVQLRPTLCNPTNCSPPGSTVHGDSPGKNTGVGCHALLHGSSQPRDRAQVSHMAGGFFTTWATRRSSRLTGVGSHSLLQGSFPTPELNQNLLHCRWILHQLSSQGSP